MGVGVSLANNSEAGHGSVVSSCLRREVLDLISGLAQAEQKGSL